MSVAREGLAATSVGNLVFLAGGLIETIGDTNLVEIYDVSQNTWSTAALALARSSVVAVSAGPFALFAGGWWSPDPYSTSEASMVDIYDTRSRSWSSFNMPYAVGGAMYSAIGVSVTTQAVIISPSKGNSRLNYTIFESLNQTWEYGTLPNIIPHPIGLPGWPAIAVSSYKGRVLVAGGGSDIGEEGSTNVFIYDTPYSNTI